MGNKMVIGRRAIKTTGAGLTTSPTFFSDHEAFWSRRC